jgi:hypothetical protein
VLRHDIAVQRTPRLVALLLVVLVGGALAVGVVAGPLGNLGGTPAPTDLANAGSGAGSRTVAPTSPPTAAAAAATPSPNPSPSPTTTPTAAPLVGGTPGGPFVGTVVPIVPVTNFRSTATSTTKDEVAATLAGTSSRYQAVELISDEADAILAALGVSRPDDASRLVLTDDEADLAADLTKSGKRLAFLGADVVGPEVRAIDWGSQRLFGVGRVKDLQDWPLSATLPRPQGAKAYDPATTWTLFAGGDILLDRGVYLTVHVNGKGVDFPFDGGTADITGRVCCSSFGWDIPKTQRTGDEGAVRDLISGADIAIANFENPAPDDPVFHKSGTVFSADPALIDGLVHAGFDYVSLANNHIRDAGGPGLLQTVKNVTKRGIKVSGAGKNLAAARTPAMLQAGGITVAILGYDAIAGSYHATATKIGSAPLRADYVKQDVAAARKAGADLVIVFPHWGTEYDPTPFANQTKLAHMIIDAGADMVIGNHAHWAAAMEVYKGRPIWYALGNFVFDQTWSEPTMEGITLELTFRGNQLAQVRIRPHIILDKAQPNFLDPAGDGRVVMGQVYSASKGLLPW